MAEYFEDKFSKININKSPTRKKKVYPPHLYPSGYESVPRAGLGEGEDPKTPSRSYTKKAYSTVKVPLENRVLSYPMSEVSTSKHDYQFSFMKETTSSIQKKTHAQTRPAPPFGGPSTTSTSSIKKRNEYSRQLSQSLRSKRLMSSGPPSDITNLAYSKKESTETSPSKSYRNSSLPKKLDVFDRLYPRPKPLLDRPQQKSTPQSLSSTVKSNSRTSALSQAPSKSPIESIRELFTEIHKKDPSLFSSEVYNHPMNISSPLSPEQIANSSLNLYEREEISRKKETYYIPALAKPRQIDIKNYHNNFGFDDSHGNYTIVPNDHINFRYEVLSVLGNGSFGNVIKALDHKLNRVVAVKIIKNDLNWSLQSLNEIKLLKLLNGNTSPTTGSPTKKTTTMTNSFGATATSLAQPIQFAQDGPTSPFILKYFDHFNFRSHICIVTELLTVNLFRLLEITEFRGLALEITQDIGSQILHGLKFIHSSNVIHCDVKPENIMIRLPSDPSDDSKVEVKIIDFGSSCFKSETSFTYIQSRYYRAPEILLGYTNYNEKIDIWSFGCILAELVTGYPLLPGRNEFDQIGCILELFGAPKASTVLKQRNALKKQMTKNFNQPNMNDRTLKKLPLFKLFDINGKLNLSLLNYYNSNPSQENENGPVSHKKIRLKSHPLDVHLGLKETTLSQLFLQALNRIFIWDPTERASVDDLLSEDFFMSSSPGVI